MTLDPLAQAHQHPHRRYNPLTGEWVLVSPHRANRPWQGATQGAAVSSPPSYDPDCYLCPGNERVNGAVNPHYSDTLVFPNDHPALTAQAMPMADNDPLFTAESVTGACRVMCYAPDHGKTMAHLSVDEIEATIQCWQTELGALGEQFKWVQIFENKGETMGCSSPHPHCQIWATSYLPALPQREDECQRDWLEQHGTVLLATTAEREAAAGERVVVANDDWLVVVPYWAAWPFETLLLPRFEVTRLTELTTPQRRSLAGTLRELTIRYDNLFQCSFPYSMGWHGAPFQTEDTSHWLLHAHFYPPLLRSASVRKFMVGFEMLAETQRDITPEMAAHRLREVSAVHYQAGTEASA
ncbi:MAG: UDP-glucose--hexose-1-phosphate uridylyltransferase [Pseudomonadota bacterium]